MPALLNLLSLLFPLCSQCAGPTSDCSPLLHGTVSLGINFPRSLSWPCLFSWLRSLSWLLQGRALYSLMLLKSLGWCPVHTGCSINTLKERLQHCYYFPRYFEFCSTPLGFIVWNFRSLWLESSTRVVGTLKFCYVTLCSIIFSAVQRSIGFCCLWDRYQLQNIFITLQGSLTSPEQPLPISIFLNLSTATGFHFCGFACSQHFIQMELCKATGCLSAYFQVSYFQAMLGVSN